MSDLKVSVKVDAKAATDEMRKARADINRRMKEGLKTAGEDVALPAAKRLAPVSTGRLRGSLVVRSSARSAHLTTSLRGKQGRYVGLMEFGGTVSTPILPRRKKALTINGAVVRSVTTPRRYKAQRFLRTAVDRNQGRIREAIRREVLRAFDGFE